MLIYKLEVNLQRLEIIISLGYKIKSESFWTK